MPLRRTIVLIAVVLVIPLLFFRVGLELPAFIGATVFLMRLWVEGIYVLSDLNVSITANQLFNIREIKRTYPLISSGLLVAEMVGGFSLGLLIDRLGLNNVLIISFSVSLVGALILWYLSESYQQAFPDSTRYSVEDEQPDYTTRRLQGPVRTYIWPLFIFFVLVQALLVLADFQFLSELERQVKGEDAASEIAAFLGTFQGILGVSEVVTQWFFSSRIVERIGVFVAGGILPATVAVLGIVSSVGSTVGWFSLFFGVVAIKFIDELFHYTLIEGTGPVLFQPLPEAVRNNFQALINGVAEPVTTGVTGAVIFGIVWAGQQGFGNWEGLQGQLLVWLCVGLCLVWLVALWLMRSRYVQLLVSSAERGRLGVSDIDVRGLKRAAVETLEKPGSEADKRSCIELLAQMDPQNVGESLAPLLEILPSSLQRQSLEMMLENPNPAYVDRVRALLDRNPPPEVMALALRYVWLTEKNSDVQQLRPFLRSQVDPVVRGTAAALILRVGNREQKAEATNALRRMLTHKQERERVMGTRALGEADFLQGLRLYVPSLLQDESLRVRCALLDAIASTRLEEYYPSLLRGLYYKSTREAAMRSLVRLDNEIVDRLVDLAEDIHKPDLVRMYAWSAIGQMDTREALDVLAAHLMSSWGTNRRNILRVLLKMPEEKGIEGVLDRLGRSGVEVLIDQELMFLANIYAALVDLGSPDGLETDEEDTDTFTTGDYEALVLLRRSLRDLQDDGADRLFSLMKFLYPLSSIQAAAFNLKSGSRSSMARGLEILDNTIDIPSKRALLSILDRQPFIEKLENLSDLYAYQPLEGGDRLRHLLEVRHFLSDWPLACCFHVARQQRWSVTNEQMLAGLRHPRGFVREAILAYLQVASPRALVELLPMLKNDPDRLVAARVREMMLELGSSPSTA